MAEAPFKEPSNSGNKDTTDKNDTTLECAVCLQTCVHPAQLPCGHIFCFLCVKGIANQSKKCAMCRQEIPRDFLEQPTLLQKPSTSDTFEGFDDGYQWFYEGRNGWWRYDERSNEEIEQAFKLEMSRVDVLICGKLYVIDFTNNYQYCKDNPIRKRSIRRDKIENLTVKGVAGWWQYDERTSRELEHFYKQGEKNCELLIAGFLYIIDLESMIQLRRNDPSRRRKIKRDLATIPKKGIAGLRTEDSSIDNTDSRPIEGRISGTSNNNIGVPITPSNTPQSPTSGRQSPHSDHHDLQATMERISSLQLDSAINNIEYNNNNDNHNSNNHSDEESIFGNSSSENVFNCERFFSERRLN